MEAIRRVALCAAAAGFALSASDLLSVLRRFYLNVSSDAPVIETTQKTEGKGRVTVAADIDGAEIFVDGDFVGSVPSTLTLKCRFSQDRG